jgi:hypothetical protein
VALETALHEAGRASARVGLALLAALVALACCALPAARDVQALAVASASCLAWGWGLSLACTPVPGALHAGARRAALACGVALAVLLAALPWLLHGGRNSA